MHKKFGRYYIYLSARTKMSVPYNKFIGLVTAQLGIRNRCALITLNVRRNAETDVLWDIRLTFNTYRTIELRIVK